MSTSSLDSDVSPQVVLPLFAAVPDSAAPDASVLEAAKQLGVDEELPLVSQLTREVFGTVGRVSLVEDPEIFDYRQIVFRVPVEGTVGDIREKERRWCRELLDKVGRSSDVFCLFTDTEPL